MRQRRGAITGASKDNSINIDTGPSSTFRSTNSGNMAFNFSAPALGSSNPAPASGFAFPSSNPAPAPTGGTSFSFGASAPASGAPAPSGGPFSFGATPASGVPTPAPAPSLFGGSPSSGSAFGAPAPAPTTTSLFSGGGSSFGNSSFGNSSSTPVPAPGGFLFGTPSPAPGGSLFGSAPAPTTGGFFAGAPQPAGAPPAYAIPTLLGSTPYASLPQDQKQLIDRIFGEIMQHKRTLCAVQVMRPRLLEKTPQQADAAAGQEFPLLITVKNLTESTEALDKYLKALKEKVAEHIQLNKKTTLHAINFAKWPSELVANRVGVPLVTTQEAVPATTEEEKKNEEFRKELQRMLDREMMGVDQVEMMPSPYLWQTIREMEDRYMVLNGLKENLKQELDNATQVTPGDATFGTVFEWQKSRFIKVKERLDEAHAQVQQLRRLYAQFETGVNVLEKARQEEQMYQQDLHSRMNLMMLKQLPASTAGPAPASGGLFNSSPAPAAGGLFGSSPAPAAGGLFGSPPAPSNGLLGTAPAPSTGSSIFGGSTPAPASGPSFFGGTPAPGAPAPSAFGTPSTGSLFGNTGASTPATAPSGGLSFGATPAAAPAGGAPAMPSFGGAAASTTPLFASTASTPKSKNKSSRGTRRR